MNITSLAFSQVLRGASDMAWKAMVSVMLTRSSSLLISRRRRHPWLKALPLMALLIVVYTQQVP